MLIRRCVPCFLFQPKTIDNDILLMDKTFGFDTAVEEAQVSGPFISAVEPAHTPYSRPAQKSELKRVNLQFKTISYGFRMKMRFFFSVPLRLLVLPPFNGRYHNTYRGTQTIPPAITSIRVLLSAQSIVEKLVSAFSFSPFRCLWSPFDTCHFLIGAEGHQSRVHRSRVGLPRRWSREAHGSAVGLHRNVRQPRQRSS